MTKQKLEQIRDAIFVLSNLSNEDWEELYGMIEDPHWVSKARDKKAERNKGITEKTISLLKKLGIPVSIKGYHYLHSAIMLFVGAENPEKIRITQELYPILGKEFNTTPLRVERAIRHAIEVSFMVNYNKLHEEIFGDLKKYKTGKPSNGEFIATIAEYLKTN